MKHIVIDARESGTTTGRYVDKLLQNLHELKPRYKVTVLTTRKRRDYVESIAPKFEVVTTPFKEFTFAEQLGLLKQIKKLAPDLVHFCMTQQPILYRGRVITTIHDLTTARFRNPAKNWLVFTIKQWVYTIVIRIVARKSRAILTGSEYVKDDVARFAHANSRKITVTYEAADKISDSPEPVEDLVGKQFIIYVGRPQPHKNLDRLVEAFVHLRKTNPGLCLVLAGKKDVLYRRLESQLTKERVGNVYFTGFVSEGQLRWLYEQTAAYVFPSLSEGFGLPGLEAMAHGAPVVSSNATCLPEIYKDGALYFDPENVEEIANAIAQVIDDPRFRAALAQKGKRVAAQYSWQRMAKQTLDVYERVLSD